MVQYDHATETAKTIEVGFSSQLKFLTSINDLGELIDECEQMILISFDNYIKHGSGSIDCILILDR